MACFHVALYIYFSFSNSAVDSARNRSTFFLTKQARPSAHIYRHNQFPVFISNFANMESYFSDTRDLLKCWCENAFLVKRVPYIKVARRNEKYVLRICNAMSFQPQVETFLAPDFFFNTMIEGYNSRSIA